MKVCTHRCVYVFIACLFAIGSSASASMAWISVSASGDGFVAHETDESFSPWGFNYDHDADGRLLEDYWIDDWSKVELAFSDMKQLGANVVRIHLQFGQFMVQPGVANQANLSQLKKLVELAEETELYLDITGLGCYHKQDVPAWYDELDTNQRWSVQAEFWGAIASVCADSPAIFCYDLMNEPVVSGGDRPQQHWLGPAFAGKHFVQFICRDRAGEEREKVAARWTESLVAAIREHDSRHLITVGLVPWSLDRPGLTSGFNPHAISPHLDFIAVHLYPETGKLEEATETLKGFKIPGKPLIVEETFPLKCRAEELSSFIDSTQALVSGWIGFFWGETREQLINANTISGAITASWLDLFQRKSKQMKGQGEEVFCQGNYPHHLQGVCVAPSGEIFWSFTTRLVRTDSGGRFIQAIDAVNHHGDLCFASGKIYVAVNLGKFNAPAGQADSWIYVYDAATLQLNAKHPFRKLFTVLVTDGDFQLLGRFPFDCSLGVDAASGGLLWAASGACGEGDGCNGRLRLAAPDDQSGLRVLPIDKSQ